MSNLPNKKQFKLLQQFPVRINQAQLQDGHVIWAAGQVVEYYHLNGFDMVKRNDSKIAQSLEFVENHPLIFKPIK